MENFTCQYEGAFCFYPEHSCRELVVPVSVGNALGDFRSSSYSGGEKRDNRGGWKGWRSHAKVYLSNANFEPFLLTVLSATQNASW